MRKIGLSVLSLLLGFWGFCNALAAQEPVQSSKTDQYATKSLGEELITRIYEVKWRSWREIARILEGFPGLRGVSGSETFNTLTVTTTEKQHVVVAELVRKYDVPPKIIEFQFHVLKASTSGEGIKDGISDQIRKVIRDIGSLTRYQRFELLDTPALRATEGKYAGLSGSGPFFYHIDIAEPGVITSGEGKARIRVDRFKISFDIPLPTSFGSGGDVKQIQLKSIGVETSFNIADGETVVLGASRMPDPRQEGGDAIITVVTARILR